MKMFEVFGLPRRLFLLGAGAVPAATFAAGHAGAAPRSEKTVVLLETCPAGLRYHDFAGRADALAAGTPLTLRREPANPYDGRAIAILTADGTQKVGYVPHVQNEALSALMDAGEQLTAHVFTAGPRGHYDAFIRILWVQPA